MKFIYKHLTFAFVVFVVVFSVYNYAYAGTLSYGIAASTDDARVTASGYDSSLTTEYLDFADRELYLRFKVDIPKNATISSAVIKLVPQGDVNTDDADIKVYLVDSDNCPAFSGAERFSDTATSVDKTITGATWHNKIGDTESPYEVDGLQSLVQAYIDRGGYDYNQYIGFHFDQTGNQDYKMCYSYGVSSTNSAYFPQLVVTYTGGDTVLSEVYMAEPYVRTKQKLYCQLLNTKAGDHLLVTVTGNEQVDRTLTAYGKDEEIVTVDYTGLTAGAQTLSVTIENSGGTPYDSSYTKNWTTLHNGTPTVGINENNAFVKNGTPFFPITLFLTSHGEVESTFTGKITGVNGTVGVGYCADGQTIATFQSFLTKCNTRGDFYVTGPVAGGSGWDGFNGDAPRDSDMAKLEAYVSQCKDYPALFAWMFDDEPILGGSDKYVPAPTCRDWVDRTYARDTNHPNWTSLVGYNGIASDGSPQGGLDEYMYMYNADDFSGVKTQIWDALSYDYYPYEYATQYEQVCLAHCLLTLDKLQEWNYNLIPVTYFVAPADVRDYFGTDTYGASPVYINATDITTEPPFQVGETVTTTSGGSGTIAPIFGTQTAFSVIRPDYDTLILAENSKTGTWAEGDTITGNDSGATATYVSVNTTRPTGTIRSYEWTPGPTAAQLKNELWLFVIHGSKAINYFDYFCPVPDANVTVMSDFKTWIEDLDQIILSGDATTTVTCTVSGDGRIDHMTKDYGGNTYIFAARVAKEANDNPGDETATFTVENMPNQTTISVYGESRNITSGDGTFTDTFVDDSVHIYQIGGETFPTRTPSTLTPPTNLKILH